MARRALQNRVAELSQLLSRIWPQRWHLYVTSPDIALAAVAARLLPICVRRSLEFPPLSPSRCKLALLSLTLMRSLSRRREREDQYCLSLESRGLEKTSADADVFRDLEGRSGSLLPPSSESTTICFTLFCPSIHSPLARGSDTAHDQNSDHA